MMRATAVFTMSVLLAGAGGHAWAGDKVAVAVVASDPALQRYEKAVQARLEEILTDSGFEPLDEKKARDLRENWADMVGPDVLITAEEIIKRAGKYEVKQVFRVSFTASTSQPLGLFHSATAQLQLRAVDTDANVKTAQSAPMGTRGFVPSDATTADAAIVNALQRAVDSMAEAAKLAVLAPASARVLPLSLEAVNGMPAGATPLEVAARPVPAGWEKSAVLAAERFNSEDRACKAVSPDGGFAVQGTLAWSIDRLAGDNARRYGGYLHLIDVAQKREVAKLTVHELGQRGAGENGSSSALACGFLGDWRFLVAASGNKLVCFDVERGRETCSVPLAGAPDKISMQLLAAGDERFLELKIGRGSQYYRITSKR
jgi:hypothetical protein